jgi:quinol monooxygenase YgiN
MFTTIRQYRCEPSVAEEIARRVDLGFADEMAKQPGFAGYEVVDCGDGTVFTISVFEDEDAAESSSGLAAAFVGRELSDLDIERVNAWTGELRVNRAGAHMSDLVHA